MNDEELTPSEKKAMQTLPKERMPQAALEDEVVRALRREGLLGSPHRRTIELTGGRVVAAVAACIAFLIAGMAVGSWMSSRHAAREGMLPAQTIDIPVSASVQRAGTAYLSVLEDLAHTSPAVGNDDVRQGREVALKTLYTAADQMSRMVPEDVLSACIVRAIAETEASGPPGGVRTAPHVIRF